MQFTGEREFTYSRRYRGPIRAVIFDWAGTTMDFGCMAPAVVFRKVFEKAGVNISMEEARLPMGAHRKVNIGLITEIPAVRRRWIEAHGSEPGDEVGLPPDHWQALPDEAKQHHRDRVYPAMYQRGAHYVVDTIADLMPVLDDIEARLKRGDKP